MEKIELTLPLFEEMTEKDKMLKVFSGKNYGTRAAMTDLCKATVCNLYKVLKSESYDSGPYGGDIKTIESDITLHDKAYFVNDNSLELFDNDSNNKRLREKYIKRWPGAFFTKSCSNDALVVCEKEDGWGLPNKKEINPRGAIYYGIRPVIKNLGNLDVFKLDEYEVKVRDVSYYRNDFKSPLENPYSCNEVEFGEFPQYAAELNLQELLNSKYKTDDKVLKKTGRTYEIPYGGALRTYGEYEYKHQKYVPVKVWSGKEGVFLSNQQLYHDGDIVWYEVSPVKWLVNEDGTLISKLLLLSGIRFDTHENYDRNFEYTNMYQFLNTSMLHNLFQSEKLVKKFTIEEIKQGKNRTNPGGFKYERKTNYDFMNDSIESGIPLFLHGISYNHNLGEVKQKDPTCEIINLRNASPESLNGKSVYNAQTGEMIDIKPEWLKNIEAKCKSEPDRVHILFFREMANVTVDVQNELLNIILDKEVNGKWKLPENVTIVVDSIEKENNKLPERLFNSFYHVYLTRSHWHDWAVKFNIHPAIIWFLNFNDFECLETSYNGKTPNVNPGKWEMASKMLYKTNNPKSLSPLLGDDITRKFVDFCNNRTISLETMRKEKFNIFINICHYNIEQKYVLLLELLNADENEYEDVKDVIEFIAPSCLVSFNIYWRHRHNSEIDKSIIDKPKERVRK